MPAPTAADLIFSEQANHNFSRKLGDIRRSTLSISNRLNSILQDVRFAKEVAEAYGRPLIANERCGSWYIDPKVKGGSAYFKSTDGHTGVWKFSSRRLNFHLLEIIGKHDGFIIVDSTRRGKRMPDALSKTIPIWCAVMNMFLYPSNAEYHQLYTPPQVVSQSEHAQITALLPAFLDSLKSLNIQPENFRKHISKPLRPTWVTPDSYLAPTTSIFEHYHPVVCCTVSRRVLGGEVSEAGYIQGAGDDTENWAHGLTPTLFWENQHALLKTSELELPDFIEGLVRQTIYNKGTAEIMEPVRPTSSLYVTALPDLTMKMEQVGKEALVIALWPDAETLASWTAQSGSSGGMFRLDIILGREKIGAKKLRLRLPEITEGVKCYLFPDGNFGKSFDRSKTADLNSHKRADSAGSTDLGLSVIESGSQISATRPGNDASTEQGKHEYGSDTAKTRLGSSILSVEGSTMTKANRILVACETGKQASIGVGLAIACLFYDDKGNFDIEKRQRKVINKDFVASRLAWFSTSLPGANPSRDVLQSVRRFLFEYGA